MIAPAELLLWKDEKSAIYCGDSVPVLQTLESGSVNCVVTSPPYWGLRDYGTATWDGGDPNCDHRELRGGVGEASAKQVTSAGASTTYQYHDVCGKCGARRIDSQLGLETTPGEYVANLVTVFQEVRRVLRDDATCWLNLGDSYAGRGRGGNPEAGTKQGTNKGSQSVGVLYGREQEDAKSERDRVKKQKTALISLGVKPKDLVGIPWMVAFALRADGWWLRSDIIWHKPNPMPSSVRDRPTTAHEYIFLLSKSKKYYYDKKAIDEPAKYAGDDRGSRKDSRRDSEMNSMSGVTGKFRNKRSVWTVTPKPFRGAHFATFPPDLIEPCILAGCPEGGVVLDPFFGAGTVGLVAKRKNRNFVGIDLNPEYCQMALSRIENDRR